ncbi:MAG: SRPBCC family protein [Actinomycetota bacterium]
MARYVVSVRSPLPADKAFAYMADLGNFAEWDPGVNEVTQVEGDAPGLDAAYDVAINAVPSDIVLRYHIITFEPDDRLVAKAVGRIFTSVDVITVVPEGDGSVVTYDAELTFSGFLGVANPVLGLVFDRVGDKAAAGLIEALEGERVEEPTS